MCYWNDKEDDFSAWGDNFFDVHSYGCDCVLFFGREVFFILVNRDGKGYEKLRDRILATFPIATTLQPTSERH